MKDEDEDKDGRISWGEFSGPKGQKPPGDEGGGGGALDDDLDEL